MIRSGPLIAMAAGGQDPTNTCEKWPVAVAGTVANRPPAAPVKLTRFDDSRLSSKRVNLTGAAGGRFATVPATATGHFSQVFVGSCPPAAIAMSGPLRIIWHAS